MNKQVEAIRAEIKRRIEEYNIQSLRGNELADLLSFLDTLQEQPVTECSDLEEAAGEYLDGHKPLTRYNWGDLMDAFKAGAEWMKEQDQPITGNSLKQEWLRYVDKEKKENRGELPVLGEYGWLKIARHFYELGQASVPMPEEQPSKDLEEAAEKSANKKWPLHPFGIEAKVDENGKIVNYDEWLDDFRLGIQSFSANGGYKDGFIAGAQWQKGQMLEDAVEYKVCNNLANYPIIYYEVSSLGLKYGDKVKVIIIKEEDEK